MFPASPGWTRTVRAATARPNRHRMKLNVFKAKIHRATVTHADREYEGSVTIDAALMEAAESCPTRRSTSGTSPAAPAW
jgi:hypothetical protein